MKATDKADLLAAQKYLRSLSVDDKVYANVDGKVHELRVQRGLRLADHPYGAWESAGVTVGYGVGRWNFTVTVTGQAERDILHPTESRKQ